VDNLVPGEMFEYAAARRNSHSGRGMVAQPTQPLAKRGRVVGRQDEAGDAVLDPFGRNCYGGANRRQALRYPFEQSLSEQFRHRCMVTLHRAVYARQYHANRAPVMLDQGGIIAVLMELDEFTAATLRGASKKRGSRACPTNLSCIPSGSASMRWLTPLCGSNRRTNSAARSCGAAGPSENLPMSIPPMMTRAQGLSRATIGLLHQPKRGPVTG